MKQGNNIRRGRGRGQRKPHGMGGQHGGGMSKGNQTYDSNGPDIRVRGNAHQVLEKYLQMARDAGVIGDRVAAENYLQHAEHYYRTIAAQTEGQRPRVGGRELSVADVNVQNVSQGLSAALYAAPASDGLPATGDQGAAAAPNGDYADDDQEHDQFNGYGQNGGQNGRDGRGNDMRGNETRGDDQRGEGPRGEGPRGEGRGPRRYQRGQNRDGQNRDNQGRDGQGREGQGRDHQGRDGQRSDRQYRDNQRQDNYRADAAAADGNRYSAPRPETAAQPAPVNREADRATAEQPDYPSELLTQPVIVQPAVVLPDAQPRAAQPEAAQPSAAPQPVTAPADSVQPSLSLSPTEEAAAPAEAPVRRGRGRPRGSTNSTPRRPRGGTAAADGEAPAAAPIDAGE